VSERWSTVLATLITTGALGVLAWRGWHALAPWQREAYGLFGLLFTLVFLVVGGAVVYVALSAMAAVRRRDK
jgi:hypothetical protein